jgi:hypothetical protein
MPSRAMQEKLYRETMDDEALARQKREAAKKCSNCGSPVRWGRDGDKHVLLDYDEHEGGNWFLFEEADCFKGSQSDPTPTGATRHYNHRATCRKPQPVQERI